MVCRVEMWRNMDSKSLCGLGMTKNHTAREMKDTQNNLQHIQPVSNQEVQHLSGPLAHFRPTLNFKQHILS